MQPSTRGLKAVEKLLADSSISRDLCQPNSLFSHICAAISLSYCHEIYTAFAIQIHTHYIQWYWYRCPWMLVHLLSWQRTHDVLTTGHGQLKNKGETQRCFLYDPAAKTLKRQGPSARLGTSKPRLSLQRKANHTAPAAQMPCNARPADSQASAPQSKGNGPVLGLWCAIGGFLLDNALLGTSSRRDLAGPCQQLAKCISRNLLSWHLQHTEARTKVGNRAGVSHSWEPERLLNRTGENLDKHTKKHQKCPASS